MPRHKVYYKGEGGGFPQVQVMVSLVNLCLLVVHSSTKMLQLCTNQLVFWFVHVCVSIHLLVNLLSPILDLQHAPLPSQCCNRECALTPFLFVVFIFGFAFESIKELGGALETKESKRKYIMPLSCLG